MSTLTSDQVIAMDRVIADMREKAKQIAVSGTMDAESVAGMNDMIDSLDLLRKQVIAGQEDAAVWDDFANKAAALINKHAGDSLFSMDYWKRVYAQTASDIGSTVGSAIDYAENWLKAAPFIMVGLLLIFVVIIAVRF